MMFSFLLRENEALRVADTLSMLTSISERVEMLSRQILQSVGTERAKLTAELYDKVLQHECARDMAYMRTRPTPKSVLSNDSFEKCFSSLGGKLVVDRSDRETSSVSPTGGMTISRLEHNWKDYEELRKDLSQILVENGVTPEAYLADSKAT